jgi:hypothetical protein
MQFSCAVQEKKKRSSYDFRLHNTSIQLGSKNAHWTTVLCNFLALEASKHQKYMDPLKSLGYIYVPTKNFLFSVAVILIVKC